MRSVTIRISDDLVAEYDRLSGSPRSRSLVMRQALEGYLQAQRDAASTAAALASAGDQQPDPLLDALAHLLDAVRYRRDGAEPEPFERSQHDAWFVLSKLHQQGYAVHRYDTSPAGWPAPPKF
jgi:predicted transcriptional regulator